MNGVREVVYNFKREGGWENFNKHTQTNRRLDHVVEIPEEDTELMMKKIDKEVNKVKHAVFGKISLKKKTSEFKKVSELQNKKQRIYSEYDGNELADKVDDINEKISTAITEIQSKQMEKEIDKFKQLKASKGKAAAVFKLRESIIGSSKSSSDPVVVVDPSSGLPMMSPEEIKTATLDYCVGLLTKRPPREDFRVSY